MGLILYELVGPVRSRNGRHFYRTARRRHRPNPSFVLGAPAHLYSSNVLVHVASFAVTRSLAVTLLTRAMVHATLDKQNELRGPGHKFKCPSHQ